MIRILLQMVILCGTCLVHFACNESSEQSTENPEITESEVDSYDNGIYCAQIEYYYANTGTSATYTLNVEIRNGRLVKVLWPNGGWLDESHFYPPGISDGQARFDTDRGAEYQVEIKGPEGSCIVDESIYIEEAELQNQEE